MAEDVEVQDEKDDADLLAEDEKDVESKSDSEEVEEGSEEETDTSDEDREGDEGEGDDEEEKEASGESDTEEDKESEEDAEARITHYSDIKKAYPDFFKKFPDIRAALFRDQEYARVLGSPKEAEQISKRAATLDNIEEDIFNKNDVGELLKTIQSSSRESFEKVSLDFMEQVGKLDKDLYYEMCAVPIKRLLRSAWKEGDGTKTDLGKAAAYIHNYFFGNYEFEHKVRGELEVKPTPKSATEKEYEKRLEQLEAREQTNFSSAAHQSYVARMNEFILAGIKEDERMTGYLRNKVAEDILVEIKSQLEKDPRYMNQQALLWKQAKSDGYTKDSKSRIVNAALARAKSLVPRIRSRLVAEALNKKVKKESPGPDRTEKNNGQAKSFKPSVERRVTGRNEGFRERRERPKSDIDILRER